MYFSILKLCDITNYPDQNIRFEIKKTASYAACHTTVSYKYVSLPNK